MYTKWTQHIKDQNEKVDFEKFIKGSKPVLDRIKDILNDEENSLDRSETDIRSFDQPNWEYKQAYKNGYRACINVIKTLVDLDQQRTGE